MITSIAAMLMFIGHLGLTGNAGAAPKATPLIAISSGQIVNLSVSTAWQESDTSIGNFGQTPVSLGMVDFATGKVTDGDYLLYVEIDLGSAPLQSANLQVRDQSGDVITVQITQGSPNFVGVFPVSNSAFTIDPEGATVGAFKIRAFRDPAAPIGAEGMLSIKTALVDSITPNLAQPLA